MSDDESATTMSISQRIAALNMNAECIPQQPTAAVSNPSKSNVNMLAGRIAALQPRILSSIYTNEKDDAGGEEGGGGTQYKTEKPKIGRLKPSMAGMVPFGLGPPPMTQKQKEREMRMEELKREAKSSTEEGNEVTIAETETEVTTTATVGKIKFPVGAVPMMLTIAPGLPPIMLKKQQEREERMAEMKREARTMDNHKEAKNESFSPTIEDALLLRPTVTGGKRRPKTRG